MTPNLNEIARKIRMSKLIAYDTETTGLDWRVHQACGYVLTFKPGDSVYLPVRHATGDNLDPDKVEGMLAEELARPDLSTVMHNAAFDLKFAAKHDIHFKGSIHDTMLMGAMCNENSGSFSLDWQARYYGTTPKKVEIYEYLAEKFSLEPNDKALMGHFWRLDANDPMAHSYACGDGDTTLELFHKLIAEIDKQSMNRIHWVESELIKVLHNMSWRGWRVDIERLERMKDEVDLKIMEAAYGLPADLNTKSPIQMEKLFRDAGYTEFRKTASGRPSFNEEFLKTTDLGRQIISVRKWSTLKSSFIVPSLTEHIYNGRIHTNFNQLKGDDYGTIGGRISSNAPNILNYPSPKRQPDQGKLFREAFIADDGYEMAEADYNQVEPRLVAHYAQIPSWIKGYNSNPPLDAHTAVANSTGLARQHGKTINMALITGAGTNKICEMLGMSEAEGKPIVDQYHRGVPELKRFAKEATKIFDRRGYVKSILGRRYHLDDPRYAYRALSRIIQGSNADIIKYALVKIARDVPNALLLNSIYDSIIWESADPRIDEAVVECMTNMPDLNLRVPLTVDYGRGRRWIDCAAG